ncbi:hypothetical protein NIIDMKKI_23960 [Mycobacterium kansasii]|uniref:Acyl-CoA dehydrogenase, N-terminal domain protein n=1 Tax=Mycobacterium kansasii TaxID=1768 RepID=A0A7G1I874_MYCKA|nr:hypothetical protein NIIDMKKI_23960 [Mycobacterium kansasii]
MAPPRLVPPAVVDPSGTDALRAEVRAFLAEQLDAGAFTPSVDAWLTQWDEQFTAALAARGWLGMTVPVEYGGHGRSFVERFVVTEELLAAGAPVAAHWVADRQIVPSLLKYGTDQQKSHFLPRIVRGECFFGIGMSEPDSGSDLASVRTRAERVAGGWSLSGTKVWTSGAHRAHAFIVLARTAPVDRADRHAGLSQFIVDLRSAGVEIRPIISMNGDHHFNEVILDKAFVPDGMVFGEIGDGWQQVTSELSFERSGPERFLSTFVLLASAAENMALQRLSYDVNLGRLVARVAGLHQMSAAVAVRCNAMNGPTSPRRWSRCSAPPPKATSPTSPTATQAVIRTTPIWCRGRSTSVRGSRCAAAPTRCCGVSSRGGWGCDDDRRSNRPGRPRPGRDDGRRLRGLSRNPSWGRGA